MRDSGLFFLSFRSAFWPVLLACALRFSVHNVGLMPCADTDVAEGIAVRYRSNLAGRRVTSCLLKCPFVQLLFRSAWPHR